VDGKGKALVTYTINDLEFDTGRSLVREEPQLDRFGEPGISRIPADGGGMGEDDAAIPVPGEKSNHQIDADGPNLRDRQPVGVRFERCNDNGSRVRIFGDGQFPNAS
jgi:hypothetical protein